MPRAKKRICDVSGIETKETNFYKNQSHVKAVDNLRRTTGATKQQMQRMFHQLNNIERVSLQGIFQFFGVLNSAKMTGFVVI